MKLSTTENKFSALHLNQNDARGFEPPMLKSVSHRVVSNLMNAGLGLYVSRRNYFCSCKKWGMTHNVLGLCEGGEIEAQMFNLAPKFIRSTMVKFSTNAPLLQNPCYGQFFLLRCFYLFVLILSL
jgi:hypothetical protein